MGSDNGRSKFKFRPLQHIPVLVAWVIIATWLYNSATGPAQDGGASPGSLGTRFSSTGAQSSGAAVGLSSSFGEDGSRARRMAGLRKVVDRGCPKVYVYKDLEFSGTPDMTFDDMVKAQSVHGNPRLRQMNQHGLGILMLHRLLTSNRCSTDDPSKADLFVIPLYPPRISREVLESANNQGNKNWAFAPPTKRYEFDKYTERIFTFDWKTKIPHLTPATADKHLIVSTASFSLMGFLSQHTRNRDFLVRLLASPTARPLLRFLWVTNTVGGTVEDVTWCAEKNNPECVLRHIPFAFPSSVRTTTLADRTSDVHQPWVFSERRAKARVHRMYFGGSFNGMKLSVSLRKKIARDCGAMPKSQCLALTSMVGFDDKLEAAFEAKRTSVFCLEPPGYGFERKSIVDSISFGCIPVIFTPHSASMWPFQWHEKWRKDTLIELDGRAYLGGAFTLQEALGGISDARIREMQMAISRHGHQLLYSDVDYPGDGLEEMLWALKRVAEKPRNRPMCWDVKRLCAPLKGSLTADVCGSTIRARFGEDKFNKFRFPPEWKDAKIAAACPVSCGVCWK